MCRVSNPVPSMAANVTCFRITRCCVAVWMVSSKSLCARCETSNRAAAFWNVLKCGICFSPIVAASEGASSRSAESFR